MNKKDLIKPSTNSKEHFPIIKKAIGKYCWDIDGKKYIDFTASNLTTVLGYRPRKAVVPNYPGVSTAEGELTSLLKKYTNTELFRFYPSGSDAVNNAIRIARHIVGDTNARVTFLGYSGSNDSYASTININGIPLAVSTRKGDLPCVNHQVKDFNSLPKYTDILVFESRYSHFAKQIKSKVKIVDCLKDGILALHNKPINSFEKGICQYLYDYDFYCYGKSIFNGSSGAILTGRTDYMKRIDEVYYSTTFGCNNDMMTEGIRTIKDFEKIKGKYFSLYNYAKEILPEWQSISLEKIKQFLEKGVLYKGYWGILACMNKSDIERLAMLCKNIL